MRVETKKMGVKKIWIDNAVQGQDPARHCLAEYPSTYYCCYGVVVETKLPKSQQLSGMFPQSHQQSNIAVCTDITESKPGVEATVSHSIYA